jgi:hypothetical protein
MSCLGTLQAPCLQTLGNLCGKAAEEVEEAFSWVRTLDAYTISSRCASNPFEIGLPGLAVGSLPFE